MGQKCGQVLDFLLELTGLDPMELQKELNPIIKKLNLKMDDVQMHDIRRIMEIYLKNTLKKSLKSGSADESDIATSFYTN